MKKYTGCKSTKRVLNAEQKTVPGGCRKLNSNNAMCFSKEAVNTVQCKTDFDSLFSDRFSCVNFNCNDSVNDSEKWEGDITFT